MKINRDTVQKEAKAGRVLEILHVLVVVIVSFLLAKWNFRMRNFSPNPAVHCSCTLHI